ncbi:hypothetical protein ABPG75_007994 [Micractinium tetrahymenae]
MRAKTLQIVWHAKEPVYSVDFHPNGQLVTGGADKEVKVWEVERGEDGYANVRHVCSLAAHLSTVNCVRFSPTGAQLASSGDGGEVLLWEPADPATAAAQRGNLEEAEGEACWRRAAALKGHGREGDVMDLSWAPDGSALATASIDSEVMLWCTDGRRAAKQAGRLVNHKHFVQGVAWDPAQQFVVTQSADRTCRVYALKPPASGRKSKVSQYLLPAGETAKDLYCAHTLSKRPLGAALAEGGAKPATHPLFADERVNTFFRRPAWSPDGSLLVLPAGVYKSSAEGKELNTAYVYARGKWAAPIMHLPGHPKPIVVVRFCPVLFERDNGKVAGQQQQQEPQAAADACAAAAGAAAAPHPFDLPYKMVFAVATLDSVVLYDTQSPLPLAVLGHLHYDAITDLAWSCDGQYLAISSRDCYCSIAAFDAGELGTPLPADKLPAHIAKRLAAAQRRAELPKAATAATPAAAKAAAAQAAAAGAAAKPAATPAATKPSEGAAGAGAAGLTAAAATPAPQLASPYGQGQLAAATQPAAASGRKRIQPEPVAALAGGTAAAAAFGMAAAAPAAPAPAVSAGAAAPAGEELQPAAKKPKRVVPEVVGPARAVVADSRQVGAEPSHQPEPVAPAAAKPPRRIIPEPIGAPAPPPATAAAAGSSAAAPPSGGVPEPPRRIIAEPVGPMPAPSSAAKSSMPAESAASGKRRIKPTPVHTAEVASQQFGGALAQQQAAQPAPSELSRDGAPASGRRITPVPVGAAQALPQGEERTATAVARGGIAAMAAAAGKQAAQERGQ